MSMRKIGSVRKLSNGQREGILQELKRLNRRASFAALHRFAKVEFRLDLDDLVMNRLLNPAKRKPTGRDTQCKRRNVHYV